MGGGATWRRGEAPRVGRSVLAMTLDAALSSAHRELVQAFTALESAGTANDALLDAVAAKLTHLKVLLTERDLLYPEALDVATHAEALVLARDVLEMGAFWSLRKKDLAQFDRYWSQLKPFYLDLVYVPLPH